MANIYGSICTCTKCNGIVHTIKRGDTLYLLSKHYGVTVNEIMNANRNINIYNLRIGDEICIPVYNRMSNNMFGDNTMQEREGIDRREFGPMEEQEVLTEEAGVQEENMSSMEVGKKIKDDIVDKISSDMKLSELVGREDMTVGKFAEILKEFDK